MAQFLWQTSLTSAAWKDLMSQNASPLFGEGHRVADEFGGSVVQSWVAFGENDFIVLVEMPSNESMAAYVLAMTAMGYYSQGKTTVLLNADETNQAILRAATYHNLG